MKSIFSFVNIFISFLFLSSCIDEPEHFSTLNAEDKFTYYSTEQGLADYEISSLFEDSKGNLWIGHYLGVSRYDGNQFQNYYSPTIIPGSISAIGEDANGDIWIGNTNGYSILSNSEWFTSQDIGIASFYLEKNKSFWVGTEEFGALRIKDGQLRQFSDNCSLCNYVTDFAEDQSGNVWFSTFGGAYKVTATAKSRFDSGNGIATDYLWAVSPDHWGNMIFGGFGTNAITRLINNTFQTLDIPVGESNVSGFAPDSRGVYISTFGAGLLYYDGTVMTEIQTPQLDYDLSCVLVDTRGDVWLGTSYNGLIKYQPKSKGNN